MGFSERIDMILNGLEMKKREGNKTVTVAG